MLPTVAVTDRGSGSQVQYSAPFTCIRLDRKRSWINKTAYTWSTKSFVVMEHVRVIAGTLMVRYGRFLSH